MRYLLLALLALGCADPATPPPDEAPVPDSLAPIEPDEATDLAPDAGLAPPSDLTPGRGLEPGRTLGPASDLTPGATP